MPAGRRLKEAIPVVAIGLAAAMVADVPATMTPGAMLLERIIGTIDRRPWWSRAPENPSDEQMMAEWPLLWPQPWIAAAMALPLEIPGL